MAVELFCFISFLYENAVGTPGTDMTYFDIPMAARTRPGVSSISNTALRIQSNKALQFWLKQLDAFGVTRDDIIERFGRQTLTFRDFEGARLMLVVDDGNGVPYG
ncbi:hypothetical protein ACQKII_07835 [Lysinibacillus sp. NPDC048646]|uniref:hypothetical protein n=1 Tax=Lysinibacillus sp. NPDC048646 TaxID=3390574 RepID=UPI003D03D421